MKSGIALAGAVVMVAAAWAIRSYVIDGDERTGAPNADAHVVCVTEAARLCAQLDHDGFSTSVEEAGITADAWSATRTVAGVDAWIAPNPWPELVDARRVAAGFEPLFSAPTAPIAVSELAIVFRTERATVAAAACPSTVDDLGWECLDELAGQPWSTLGGNPQWGSVKVGIKNPATSGTGALLLAQAVTARVGTPNFGREIFDDPAFSDWFTNFARSVPPAPVAGTPLEQFLAVPATYDVIAATSGQITTVFGSADPERSRQFGHHAVTPPATAQLVVAPLGEPNPDVIVTRVRDDDGTAALRAQGWTPTNGPFEANGLPDGGTLEVIRQRWQEALR